MTDRLRFYVRHSLNDLRVNRQRTLFALLCIAAGVAAVVSLQTLGVMITETLTGSLQEANKGDLHIFSGPEGEVSEAVQAQGVENGILEPGGLFYPDYFGPEGIARLQDWFDTRFPGQATLTIQQTFSDLTTGAAVSLPARDAEKTFVSVYIVDAQRFPLYGERRALDGSPLGDLLRQPTDIVISQNLAEALGAQVGDVLRVAGASADFTLRGVVPTEAEGGVDNLFAGLFGYYYLDLSAAPFFSQTPATYDVFVRLADPAQVDAVDAAFKTDFPYLTTTTTQDLADRNSQASGIITKLVTVMGLVSLLIGGIGIVNTMLVIVSRRSTEIAILKTVGLEPGAVTALFLTEAILMGLAGSVAGVLLGWIMALVVKGVAENFVAQSLAFRIAPGPAITGLAVGILITTIFGMLPTLAAGQVRPSLVLRPSETVVPRAGRRRSFLALLGMLVVLSAITQALTDDLLASAGMRAAAGGVGLVMGGAAGLLLARRRFQWLLYPAILAAGGFAFGQVVPALLLAVGMALLVGLLYATLWALIWAAGGGALNQFPLVGRLPRWLALPVLGIALLPLWLVWGIGRLIQRYGFVDLKIAMRSLLAARGRAASTLLALVIGVFTLSLITMLVDSITQQFEAMLEREAGGNVFVLAPGGALIREQITGALDALPGVSSYATVVNYETSLISITDGDTGTVHPAPGLDFESIDGRELGSNLPDVTFYRGRQLTPADAGQRVIVIEATDATLDAGLDVGDSITFGFSGAEPLTFTVVGMVDHRAGGIQLGTSASYVPLDAFPPDLIPTQVITVVNVDEAQLPALRRVMADISGTFVLETRFLNDVVNRLIDQFTAFPILVAALALFTGGVVIANSVALSTLERRREIGIMKAVGLQREHVLGMLLLEQAVTGLIGGLIGVGIGLVILIGLLAGFFGGSITQAIPIGSALGLMALCIGIALAAALLSVWGASGEKPLNVLRYE